MSASEQNKRERDLVRIFFFFWQVIQIFAKDLERPESCIRQDIQRVKMKWVIEGCVCVRACVRLCV